MMGVVVHEKEAIALVFDFEAAPCVLKPAQRNGHFVERNSDLAGERNYPEGVAHVVTARNVQHRCPKLFAAMDYGEDRSEIPQIDIAGAVIRPLRKTERDRTRMLAANACGVRIVGAIKDRAAGLIEELGKDLFDRGKIGIKIEMLLLDVQDQRMLGPEEAYGAIA